MSIYTRRGDKGETTLPNGRTISKDDTLLVLAGTIDELNASVGIARTFMKIWPEKQNVPHRSNLSGIMKQLQSEFMHVHEMIEGANIEPLSMKQKIKYWEQVIDGIDVQLPPLKFRVLPGGSRVAALLYLSRAICRRAERVTVTLNKKEPSEFSADLVQYLNRISHLLFILARLVNKLRDVRDVEWETGGHVEETMPQNQNPNSVAQSQIIIGEETIIFEEHDALDERWG